MPVGQFLGNKSDYVYTSDSGRAYKLTIDDTLVVVGSGLTEYDPDLGANVTPPPKRFKPRGVYWEATDAAVAGKRKFLICGATNGALYASDSKAALTIDGFAGLTTGRRGEKQTF